MFSPSTNQSKKNKIAPPLHICNAHKKKRPCRAATRDTVYPRVEATFDDLIDALLKSRTCKYMLADGGTAAKAVNGRQCGQLVTTGTEFLTRSMAFATPHNWPPGDELARAMLTIHNGHQLPSFQEYVDNFHTCAQTTLPTISVKRLKVFFALSVTFGVCVLVGMLVDPQNPVNGNGNGNGNEHDMSVVSSSSSSSGERDDEDDGNDGGDDDDDDVDVEMSSSEKGEEREEREEGVEGGRGGEQRGEGGNDKNGVVDANASKTCNRSRKEMDEDDGNVLEQKDSMKSGIRDESSSSSTTKPN